MLSPSRQTDVALIHDLWDEYASAFVTGDIERWISLWTHGGVEMSAVAGDGEPINRPSSQGRIHRSPGMSAIVRAIDPAEMVASVDRLRVLRIEYDVTDHRFQRHPLHRELPRRTTVLAAVQPFAVKAHIDNRGINRVDGH